MMSHNIPGGLHGTSSTGFMVSARWDHRMQSHELLLLERMQYSYSLFVLLCNEMQRYFD